MRPVSSILLSPKIRGKPQIAAITEAKELGIIHARIAPEQSLMTETLASLSVPGNSACFLARNELVASVFA